METQFTAMYRRELPYVWKMLCRLGTRPNDREDLAHDVFATAFRQWHRYEASRPVRPWLLGITYRVVLDFKRKHQNYKEEASDVIDVQDEGDSVETQVAHQEGMTLARRVLETLELDRRTVFILHEIEGIPIPEVADSLGIPLNTAYSRLRLARRDFNLAVNALQAPRGKS